MLKNLYGNRLFISRRLKMKFDNVPKTLFWEKYKEYSIHVDMDRGYTLVAPLDARVIMSQHKDNEKATPEQHIEIAKQLIDKGSE